MKVVHRRGRLEVDGSHLNGGFLLCDGRGGYLSLASPANETHYQGLAFPVFEDDGNWDMMKVLENIYVEDMPVIEVANCFTHVERKYSYIKESLHLLRNGALVAEYREGEGKVVIECDVRRIYDFGAEGRNYRMHKQGDSLIIEYNKFADGEMHHHLYTHYIVIKGVEEYEQMDEWRKKNYPYDQRRGTSSGDTYVYAAVKIPVKRKGQLIICHGNNLGYVVQQAEETAAGLSGYKHAVTQHLSEWVKPKVKSGNDEVDMAYRCAMKAITDLTVDFQKASNLKTPSFGVYAGLPWFFQFWSRDESISLGGLISMHRFDDVKQILHRLISTILDDGRIFNRFPESGLGSADGVGWAFRRWLQLFVELGKHHMRHKLLSGEDTEKLRKALELSISRMEDYYLEGGLIVNDWKETWMDTTGQFQDGRKGARVEIQALYLGMLKLLRNIYTVTNFDKYKELKQKEQNVKQKVREKFFDGQLLADGVEKGIPDKTIRPNIFLAHYIYPDLLDNGEWITVFGNSLEKLWLDWGGLSTIDIHNEMFQHYHSGQNNDSYHRGDSWYWVNNMAAVSLHQVDKVGFAPFIEKIMEASTREILYGGWIGHHAEISSAEELTSFGTFAQAWSAATFVELVEEVFSKDEK